MYKFCKKCRNNKALSDFHRFARSKDGFRSTCKLCHNKENKKYYSDNKDKILKRCKNYYNNNIETINHYSNLQPLWASENSKKGATYEERGS